MKHQIDSDTDEMIGRTLESISNDESMKEVFCCINRNQTECVTQR